MKEDRTRLGEELTKQHRKMQEYRTKFYNAERAYKNLDRKYRKLDRKVFDQDPGVTVVPTLKPRVYKLKEEEPKPIKISADTVKTALGDEALKRMLEAVLAKKQEERNG